MPWPLDTYDGSPTRIGLTKGTTEARATEVAVIHDGRHIVLFEGGSSPEGNIVDIARIVT